MTKTLSAFPKQSGPFQSELIGNFMSGDPESLKSTSNDWVTLVKQPGPESDKPMGLQSKKLASCTITSVMKEQSRS